MDKPICNIYGQTTGWIAASAGDVDVFKLLVKNNYDITTPDNNNVTPLDIASENGHTEIVDIIKKITTANELWVAVSKNDTERVRQLISTDIDVNRLGPDGTTPLGLACLKGYSDVVEILLTHKKIDIDKINFK